MVRFCHTTTTNFNLAIFTIITNNFNFLDCDWFKKFLFSRLLIHLKLLLDSLLSDSSAVGQSHSKLQFKSINLIQRCSYMRACVRTCICVFGAELPVGNAEALKGHVTRILLF